MAYKYENWHLIIIGLILLGLYGGGYLQPFIGAVTSPPELQNTNYIIYQEGKLGSTPVVRIHPSLFSLIIQGSNLQGGMYEYGYYNPSVNSPISSKICKHIGPTSYGTRIFEIVEPNNGTLPSGIYELSNGGGWGSFGCGFNRYRLLYKSSYVATTSIFTPTTQIECSKCIIGQDQTYTCWDGSIIKLGVCQADTLCSLYGGTLGNNGMNKLIQPSPLPTCPDQCILGATQTETCWDASTITKTNCVHNWFGNTWEATGSACTADPCLTKTCPDYCDSTTKYSSGSCQIGQCAYTVEYNAAACQPAAVSKCAGVTCSPDTCIGTTKVFDGVCNLNTGECEYSQTPNALACGYNPCTGVVCPDKCEGTTYKSIGQCQAGSCVYTDQPDSQLCIVNPCADITCEANHCEGTTRVYGGQCDMTGTCQYSQETNSATCGYKAPVTDTTIDQGTDPLSDSEQDQITDNPVVNPIESTQPVYMTYWWVFLVIGLAIAGYIIYKRR
jgi:hypothetical protein